LLKGKNLFSGDLQKVYITVLGIQSSSKPTGICGMFCKMEILSKVEDLKTMATVLPPI